MISILTKYLLSTGPIWSRFGCACTTFPFALQRNSGAAQWFKAGLGSLSEFSVIIHSRVFFYFFHCGVLPVSLSIICIALLYNRITDTEEWITWRYSLKANITKWKYSVDYMRTSGNWIYRFVLWLSCFILIALFGVSVIVNTYSAVHSPEDVWNVFLFFFIFMPYVWTHISVLGEICLAYFVLELSALTWGKK